MAETVALAGPAAERTRTGKYIRVVFEMDEENGVVAVRPVTAFALDDD